MSSEVKTQVDPGPTKIKLKLKVKSSEPEVDPIYHVLNTTFGLSSFRPNQLEIVKDIMAGKDILALLPTGSGKSLCYQLPAVLMTGLTIVISPLLSLIDDQLQYLSKIGIKSTFLNSQTDVATKRALFSDLGQEVPTYKLLYTTPETIISNVSLRENLDQLYNNGLLKCLVIDEAHCVSNWGHDFRPSYLQIRQLRQLYPKVQTIAFTATATPKVQIDIIKQLNMDNMAIHRQSFIRPNLSYYVRPKTAGNIDRELARLIRGQYAGQSGIIYCLSRADCEELSRALNRQQIQSSPFHAGLTPRVRHETQTGWLDNRIQVIVATIAFGLGINKPDVRFVIHHTMPKSIEGYYQETGRAGRDGQPSDCILYYSFGDKKRLLHIMRGHESEAPTTNKILIEYMDSFCNNRLDCRKRLLSNYLGEYIDFECKTGCDNCQKPASSLQDQSHQIPRINQILATPRQVSQRELEGHLGLMTRLALPDIQRLIALLVTHGCLQLQTCLRKTGEIAEVYQVIEPYKLPQLWLRLSYLGR